MVLRSITIVEWLVVSTINTYLAWGANRQRLDVARRLGSRCQSPGMVRVFSFKKGIQWRSYHLFPIPLSSPLIPCMHTLTCSVSHSHNASVWSSPVFPEFLIHTHASRICLTPHLVFCIPWEYCSLLSLLPLAWQKGRFGVPDLG